MALSDDQRAMLRLLAQREQGYEDIAALMGISVDDVRARVRDALAQLEDEGKPAPDLPPQPEPPPAPEPTREPEPEPSTPPKAPEPPAEPQPEPAPPVPPEAAAKAAPAPAPKPAAPASKPADRSGGPRFSLPSGRGPLAAVAAAVAVIVVVALVLILSSGGGDDGATTTTNAASTAAEEAGEGQGTPTSNGKQVTKAVLEPVGGGSASGVATFGRIKNSLALQIEAEGLAPTAAGQSYAIWLAQSPQRMLPLASTPVDKSGRIGAQFEVPVEVLAYLANETFDQLAITLTSNSRLKASLAKATKNKESPGYTGIEVLRGTVEGPIVGAANRQK